jgi:hypothetical protein
MWRKTMRAKMTCLILSVLCLLWLSTGVALLFQALDKDTKEAAAFILGGIWYWTFSSLSDAAYRIYRAHKSGQ